MLLPGGTVHAVIERSGAEEWNVYVGDERYMSLGFRVSSFGYGVVGTTVTAH